MARGKGKEKKIDFQDIKWVLNNLNDTELDAMDAFEMTAEALLESFEELISDGWNVSLRHDDYSNCPSCSIQMARTGNLNSGFAVSGRGDTAFDAMKIVYWKFFVVGERDLSQFQEVRKSGRG